MKTSLGVVHNEHNALVAGHIKAAREYFERANNRAYITQTWQWKFEAFSREIVAGALRVPRPPLQSVTSITYVDTAGDSQTWDSDSYDVSTAKEPGCIKPAYGETWPIVRGDLDGVTVTFVAGYGTAITDVPATVRAMLMQFVAGQYEAPDGVSNRGLAENPVMQRLERLDSMATVA
jgi:uncharacterized phiE125 gp8 family phage protein